MVSTKLETGFGGRENRFLNQNHFFFIINTKNANHDRLLTSFIGDLIFGYSKISKLNQTETDFSLFSNQNRFYEQPRIQVLDI